MEGLSINETSFPLENGEEGKLAIFLYSGSSDPKPILDWAVNQYAEEDEYIELMDAHMNNPWMRVVITDVNKMNQVKFDDFLRARERDKKLSKIIK